MLEKPIQLPAKLAEIFKHASAFAENAKTLTAFHAATRDPKIWEIAIKDPEKFLNSKGVKVPDGIKIRFIEGLKYGKPTPDHEFFTIRQFNCRHYWVRNTNGPGYQEGEVCFGFEITSNPLPPIA